MELDHLPEEAREWFLEGFEHHQAGELDRALECYRRSIEVSPSAEAHTFLGWALSHQGKLQEAIEECLRAIEVDPSLGNPHNDIGVYCMELGREDEAIEWLEKALQAERYESYHFPHLNLGRIYLRRGLFLKAREQFEKALEFEPNYHLARMELAKLRALMN
jgi:tetratricopeptide (TPR) repeat protein